MIYPVMMVIVVVILYSYSDSDCAIIAENEAETIKQIMKFLLI